MEAEISHNCLGVRTGVLQNSFHVKLHGKTDHWQHCRGCGSTHRANNKCDSSKKPAGDFYRFKTLPGCRGFEVSFLGLL